MRIQTSDIIAGQPALAIRKLLKNRDGTISTAVESLQVDHVIAKQVLDDLSLEGYITFTAPLNTREDRLDWQNTIKGHALANATARKAITRVKAEQLLTAFLERIKEINACDDY